MHAVELAPQDMTGRNRRRADARDRNHGIPGESSMGIRPMAGYSHCNSCPTGQQGHTSSGRILRERLAVVSLPNAHLPRSPSLPHHQTPPIRYTRIAVSLRYDVMAALALHNSISRKHAGDLSRLYSGRAGAPHRKNVLEHAQHVILEPYGVVLRLSGGATVWE